MKLSRFTRFVRVNLIGLLAISNLLIVFLKFKVERPQTILYRCDGKHKKTGLSQNAVSVARGVEVSEDDSPPVRPSPVRSALSVVPSPASHGVQGDWSGTLIPASCNYAYMVADVPLLSVGDGLFYRRGDLTKWGRIKWIGRDFFTTDTHLVSVGVDQAQLAQVGAK